MTVDLRNTDEPQLREAERRLAAFTADLAQAEGVTVTARTLARLEPVIFDADIAGRIERVAGRLGHSIRRMTSGAGHDAQMMARICPAAMIFTPSVGGLSHNVKEFTRPEDLKAGADVLLHTLIELAEA